ncbi:MAG: EamA family transporter, partial [Sphingomonadales bacterium]|nr:EamA family transporter [Sphingomonadales bacterium]
TLPLLVAVIFALFMLTTRQIAKEADPIALQAISGGLASAVLIPVLLVGQGTGLAAIDPVLPGAGDWGLLLALGLLGTGGHLLMTWSLRFAPSATLAPMQYLEIPFATLIGWILFGHLPNALAGAGIAITILAGLYVIARERRPRPAPGLA